MLCLGPFPHTSSSEHYIGLSNNYSHVGSLPLSHPKSDYNGHSLKNILSLVSKSSKLGLCNPF
ncbi:hypothetical protein DERF_002106 [Dermatophagoides farinae]|uniref:Uncharacterized protein n=1 Tax=Dermatophagoides farinae TaxID=6954 RepID=A0A922IAV0_DERFA|nr:hypothetical protein DERF_002106 [Dermatophagoides farinae]